MRDLAKREAGADQGFAERRTLRHADAAIVEECAATLARGEELVAARVVDHRLGDRAAMAQRDGNRVLRKAVDEVGGAVERIDDPGVVRIAMGTGLLR